MRYLAIILVMAFTACSNNTSSEKQAASDSVSKNEVKAVPEVTDSIQEPLDTSSTKVYSNARFRQVTVQKVGENSYRVRGQGQIFEANFNWVIEDGHEELAKGYQMTDAGAPEWGNFDFTIKATKKRANSTLHLIIFEISMKDGSRVHELPILLG